MRLRLGTTRLRMDSDGGRCQLNRKKADAVCKSLVGCERRRPSLSVSPFGNGWMPGHCSHSSYCLSMREDFEDRFEKSLQKEGGPSLSFSLSFLLVAAARRASSRLLGSVVSPLSWGFISASRKTRQKKRKDGCLHVPSILPALCHFRHYC